MYMRMACAACLFLMAAHSGRSQTHFKQQLRTWGDYATALSNSDAAEHQQIFVSRGGENSLPSEERISVVELRHKVPGKAMSAFIRGMKWAAAGDFLRAAKDFERAVTIDPEYSTAHGNLGVMYINLALPDQAAGEFRRAIQLDPTASSHHANLALALILLKLHKEAEHEAQTAVNLDHSNSKARYLLGFLLARRPETRGKAEEHLMYAARQMPDAHLILADMYRLEGAEALAQKEQEQYRKTILEAVKAP